MKILVTGGAGFIGSNLVDELIKKNYEVVVVDNLSSGKKNNLNPKAKFYKIDIRDKKISKIFDKHKFDLVNNHAAQISVTKSVRNPIEDAQINIIGLINLLENAKRTGVKKFINVSSGGVVYGEKGNMPFSEKDPFNPKSPYGVSKTAGEYYLNFYNEIHNINFTSLRYSNVYGPRQDPHGEAGVIAIFSRLMLNGKQPKIFGSGEQMRDYVFVEDVVDANIKSIKKGDNEAFNIATQKPTSVNELFSIMKELTGYNGEPKYASERPGEVFKNFLDISKAEKKLGWEPKYDLKSGLKKTINWFKNN
ncbi:NAD-dependent epimerase/dehydratase family protein [Candidatus Woesearchaeota archaeon]|nr:NAD-dependent epimerase/dehydratase family protein [Candidatus Woesearchaeota archaeon]